MIRLAEPRLGPTHRQRVARIRAVIKDVKGLWYGDERPGNSKKVVRSQVSAIPARVRQTKLAILETTHPSLPALPNLPAEEAETINFATAVRGVIAIACFVTHGIQ